MCDLGDLVSTGGSPASVEASPMLARLVINLPSTNQSGILKRMAKRSSTYAGRTVTDASTRKTKAQTAMPKIADLAARFKAAHAKGMKALEQCDYDVLDGVINEEAKILRAHRQLITAHLKESGALSAKITATLKNAHAQKKR
jgi:hypothetical protein